MKTTVIVTITHRDDDQTDWEDVVLDLLKEDAKRALGAGMDPDYAATFEVELKGCSR